MAKGKELEAIRKLEAKNAALRVELQECMKERTKALELARKAAELAREVQDQSDSYRAGINALGEDIAGAIIHAYLATTTEEASQSSH